MRIVFITLLSLALSACVVGPNYKRPPAITPQKFKEAKGKSIIGKNNKKWKLAQPRDHVDRGAWWTVFNDKDLNNLEEELNKGNQNIEAAYANFVQAMALVDEARAAYYPTIVFTGVGTRQKIAGGGALFSSSNSSTSTATATSAGTSTSIASGVGTAAQGKGASSVFSYYSYVLGGSWQPDIWGLVRRTVESDIAGAQSSGSLFANTRLSMQGTLAQTYYELRTLDMNQKLLDLSVAANKKLLQLTRNQYVSGVVSRANILQAQSQLETAEAQAINNGVNRAIYEHAIAVLIGRPPANFTLAPKPLTQTPPAIPLMLPSELLERRPDIAQAERTMAQTSAQIGVAIAAYYPAITLSGNVNALTISSFSFPPLGWAYGAQLVQYLYDGGLRDATLRAAMATYQSAVASYRQVVLAAFQNVEDNLSNLRILAKEEDVLLQLVSTTKKSLQLVINEYKSGTVDLADTVTSQLNVYSAELNATNIAGLRMTSAVALITALGGGWSTPCGSCVQQ